ncbi:GNAT family N-acetyltransferase [Streptomyces sp. NPDC085665]|uniref:GNAT family N-acetyltransferase n=1 Tax=Streptomyces sp. NPDC085665 TaxID=3365735 RepID=UPI0037D5AEFD
MSYKIHDAGPEDLPDINAIGATYSDTGWAVSHSGGILPLDRAECVLVCRLDAPILGWLYADLGRSGRIIIERLITAPHARGRGVATELVAELARRYPDRCLVAGVGPEDVAFYERVGFLPDEEPFEPMIKPPLTPAPCCHLRPAR